MKITSVEALHLRLPNVEEIADGTQDVLIIRIHTDAGITGVGEVSSQSYVCKSIFEAPRSAGCTSAFARSTGGWKTSIGEPAYSVVGCVPSGG